MTTIAIVGVGLIGGSFGLALKKAGFPGRRIGVSSPSTVEKALAAGAIDEALPFADAVAQADLIYLAQPIQQILECLASVDRYARPSALITDVGSTKAIICDRAADAIRRARFVGGHPMAGKESRGVEAADADLFRNRPYVLTAREPALERWIEAIGARVVFLDPAEHDRLVALVSHLPQLLSTALAGVIADHPGADQVAGPAAVDLTRLALSSYDLWRDIFATNFASIDDALDAFISKLQALRVQLRSPEMERVFEKAGAAARALRRSS